MYSKEQITKIRSLINSQFERGDVYDKLKQKIESSGLTLENIDSKVLTNLLQETNLIDNLLLDINHLDDISQFNKKQSQKVTSIIMIRSSLLDFDKINYRSISIRIYQGKAFLDFMGENREPFQLQLYLSFCGQRYKSQLTKADPEPEFNELFVFDLRTEGQKANIDFLNLSKLEHPIELSLVLINEKNEIRTLYSQKLVEWRFLLSYGNINLNIEMPLIHEQRQKANFKENPYQRQSVGLLQVHIDLLPKSGLSLIPETVLTTQLSREKTLLQASSDRFHTYSSAWWNDYKELKLPIRPVKLYAESQDGVWRPCTSFISELVGVRGIQTPNHAARFVSLIPFRRNDKGPQNNQERAEIWHRFTSFLSARSGDFEDHCTLLCSLLLGFNMEAYMVIGSSSDGAHGWVMTRQKKPQRQGQNKQSAEYVYHFYESLTGHKFELNDPKVNQMYKKVGCVFNHKYFYANIQPIDQVSSTDFNIEDFTKWKALDPMEVQSVRLQNSQLRLIPSSLDCDALEDQMEHKLRDAVSGYRKVLNLVTRFDDKLNSIMQIALANYETEKLTGIGIFFHQKGLTYCQQEFQSCIRSYIPEGHIFKAFPIQFTHMNVDKILEAIKQSQVGGEIVTARGDQAYFSLKVKLEAYPEDIYALWVVIAVRYHQTLSQ